MKRKRRIEITAWRRHITVVTGNVPSASASKQPPQKNDDGLWSSGDDPSQVTRPDLIQRQLKVARSREVSRLIESLIVSDAASALAVKRLGLSPKSLYLKLLRAWGLSLKQLTGGLNNLRGWMNNHRRPLNQTTRDAKKLPSDREEIP